MNFYCIKCLMFTKDRNTKIIRKLDEKINNLYSCCIDCGLKNFETIHEKGLSYLLERLI